MVCCTFPLAGAEHPPSAHLDLDNIARSALRL